MGVLLEVKNLGISFGGLRAVDGLNMTINEGALVGLIGPNGAGKTTAFNMLTGVYRPTDGTIMLDGKSVDISKLNFNFDVRGKASWKPERVFDDGEKIYIHLPRKTTELPVLLARRKGENVLVNYRADGKKLVVDGIFDELTLLRGVGAGKEEIRIIRKS